MNLFASFAVNNALWLMWYGFVVNQPDVIMYNGVSQLSCKSIIHNKPTRCNSGSIVFINNYKYALHISDVLCVHHQEHYKL